MKTHNRLPKWAQWAAGLGLMSIAVGAGCLGLYLNVSHGLESGPASATLYGLADLGKILIPIVAVAIGWTRHSKITVAICAAVSIWCAVNYYADTEGRKLLAAGAQNERHADARASIEAARAELKTITETGDAAGLAELAAAAKALAVRETGRGGCLTKCEAANAKADLYLERAGQARRKATLEARIAAGETKAESGMAQASGLAMLIAAATGWSEATVGKAISAFRALIAIVLIETLVYLNAPAARLLGQAMAKKKVRAQAKAKPAPKAKKKPVAKRAATQATVNQIMAKAIANAKPKLEAANSNRAKADAPA